jgi:large subunit ribosomal protein L6
MKRQYEESISIPNGIDCLVEGKNIKCKKDSKEISRKLDLNSIEIQIKDNKLILKAVRGTKRELKVMMSFLAHLNNMFKGLSEKFSYSLEACNVHFPMTLKLEKGRLVINNFLGERVPRYAKILPGVDVDLDGVKITVSSNNKEQAGHTAANIEKATKVRGRDRRVFQDGIFITSKPGEESK